MPFSCVFTLMLGKGPLYDDSRLFSIGANRRKGNCKKNGDVRKVAVQPDSQNKQPPSSEPEASGHEANCMRKCL